MDSLPMHDGVDLTLDGWSGTPTHAFGTLRVPLTTDLMTQLRAARAALEAHRYASIAVYGAVRYRDPGQDARDDDQYLEDAHAVVQHTGVAWRGVVVPDADDDDDDDDDAPDRPVVDRSVRVETRRVSWDELDTAFASHRVHLEAVLRDVRAHAYARPGDAVDALIAALAADPPEVAVARVVAWWEVTTDAPAMAALVDACDRPRLARAMAPVVAALRTLGPVLRLADHNDARLARIAHDVDGGACPVEAVIYLVMLLAHHSLATAGLSAYLREEWPAAEVRSDLTAALRRPVGARV